MIRLILGSLLSLGFITHCRSATILYSFADLGTFEDFVPSALNDRGWIVGSNPSSTFYGSPHRYRPGVGIERLSMRGGYATDINDAGTAVGGLVRDDYTEFAITRPAGEPWAEIEGVGGPRSLAYAINESGQIVGWSGPGGGHRAFLYTPGVGTIDIGTLGGNVAEAIDINESGQVLGWSHRAGGFARRTFLYDPVLGMIDIDAIGGVRFNGTALWRREQMDAIICFRVFGRVPRWLL